MNPPELSVEHVDAHDLGIGRVHQGVEIRCDRLGAERVRGEREAGALDYGDTHHLAVA